MVTDDKESEGQNQSSSTTKAKKIKQIRGRKKVNFRDEK